MSNQIDIAPIMNLTLDQFGVAVRRAWAEHAGTNKPPRLLASSAGTSVIMSIFDESNAGQYALYMNGQKIADVSGNGYTVTDLQENTAYNFYVLPVQNGQELIQATSNSVGVITGEQSNFAGSYTIEGTNTDPGATLITAQLKDSTGQNVGQPVQASISESEWSATISNIPPGDGYTVEVTDNAGNSSTSPDFIVGLVIVGNGQSEQTIQHGQSTSAAVQYLGTSSLHRIATSEGVVSIENISAGGFDSLTSKANQIIRDAPELTGLPFIMVRMSYNGSGIEQWLTAENGGTDVYWTADALPILSILQGVNIFDLLFGTTDAGMEEQEWLENVERFYLQVEAELGLTAETIPAVITPVARKIPMLTNMRGIQIRQGDSGGRYYPGAVVNDIILDFSPYPTDNTTPHQLGDSAAGGSRLASYIGRAIASALGFATPAVRGPVLSSATFTDANQNSISLDINDGTNTVPVHTPDGSTTGILGFEINVDSGGWSESGFTASISNGVCYLNKDSGDWSGSTVEVRYMDDSLMNSGATFGAVSESPFGQTEAEAAEAINMAAFDKTLHDTTNFNDGRGVAVYRQTQEIIVGAA